MSYVLQKSELFELVKSPLYEFNVGPIPPPAVYQFTAINANYSPGGLSPISLDFNYKNGNSYMTFQTLLVIDIGSGPVTVTGQMTFDRYNGSILSRTIDQPPPGTMVAATDSNSPIAWPPTSIPNDTTAEWIGPDGVEQSLSLSDPVTIDDTIVTADSLLDAANLPTLGQGHGWLTGYELHPFISTSDNIFGPWWATWVPDPLIAPGPTGQPALAAWANMNGTVILDRDLPSHVDRTIFISDLGPYSPGNPGPNTGPCAIVDFGQGGIGGSFVASTSRLLVRLLKPSSDHCAAIIYDADGHTAGNADNAITVTADGAGNLTLFHPDLLILSTSGGETGTSWLYINQHTSGITCAP